MDSASTTRRPIDRGRDGRQRLRQVAGRRGPGPGDRRRFRGRRQLPSRRRTSRACPAACRCATRTAGAGSTRSRPKSPKPTATARALVVTCSALKRAYRDRLRLASPHMLFVYLEVGREMSRQSRVAGRKGHFMPASLIDSQFAALEPPAPDETAIWLDATRRSRPPGGRGDRATLANGQPGLAGMKRARCCSTTERQ